VLQEVVKARERGDYEAPPETLGTGERAAAAKCTNDHVLHDGSGLPLTVAHAMFWKSWPAA
jgi:hypothetical protein